MLNKVIRNVINNNLKANLLKKDGDCVILVNQSGFVRTFVCDSADIDVVLENHHSKEKEVTIKEVTVKAKVKSFIKDLDYEKIKKDL